MFFVTWMPGFIEQGVLNFLLFDRDSDGDIIADHHPLHFRIQCDPAVIGVSIDLYLVGCIGLNILFGGGELDIALAAVSALNECLGDVNFHN